MGSPFFSWRPHSESGDRVQITIPEALSDLQVTPVRDVLDAITYCGKYRRMTLRPSVKVRVVLERFTDRDLFRQFSAMINHLERGGRVAFGVDDAKCWGGTLMPASISVDHQGTTRFDVGPNQYQDYATASASVTVPVGSTSDPYGDEIIIESAPPQAAREYHVCYAVASVSTGGGIGAQIDIDNMGTAVTKQRTRMDYWSGTHVRISDFWPFLMLPAGNVGAALLVHDHRIAYTLDLELEYVIPDLNEEDAPPISEQQSDQPSGSSIVPGDHPDLQGDPFGGSDYGGLVKVSVGDMHDWRDLPMLSDMLKGL